MRKLKGEYHGIMKYIKQRRRSAISSPARYFFLLGNERIECKIALLQGQRVDHHLQFLRFPVYIRHSQQAPGCGFGSAQTISSVVSRSSPMFFIWTIDIVILPSITSESQESKEKSLAYLCHQGRFVRQKNDLWLCMRWCNAHISEWSTTGIYIL